MLSALITGTSTGIGLETALLFARRGFRVYAGARNPAASEVLERAVADGLSLTPIALDVDRDESVRQVGVEAIIPMDAHSGRDLGARAHSPPVSFRDLSRFEADLR
jgi:NAD(P)-dependent dehydrogenase (short-subunit alcohol dehydrogenase family)